MTPSIAVAVTTFNQSKYIRQTLNSVLSQTRVPAEVVVLDDGSTDDTPAILAEFRERVRIIRQKNAGVAGARNAAVLACTADYIALLDGDDLWHPLKLQRCAELLEAFGPTSLLVHDVDLISQDGAMICCGLIAERLRDAGLGDAAVHDCLEPLIAECFIWTTSQVVVRRSDYVTVGLSDPSFPVGSDFDLYLRLAARGSFLLCGEALSQWRQHEASASGRAGRREFNWAIEAARALRKARARPEMANHLAAIAQRQGALVREVYRLEARYGKRETLRALARIAWSCRSAYAVLAAVAVLAPQSVRRATAALMGASLSITR